jgi:hypothetical protein
MRQRLRAGGVIEAIGGIVPTMVDGAPTAVPRARRIREGVQVGVVLNAISE